MIVGKVRPGAYPRVPEIYVTRVGSGLTYKHYSRLERFFGEKHPSLLSNISKLLPLKIYNIGGSFSRLF